VSSGEPNFRLATITSGAHDAYILRWAKAARAWGHPFFLRFDREMNLNCCYPYTEGRNGNTSGDFVAMWRHVHRLFHVAGATNVTWVWAPNVAYAGSTPLSAVYPGKSYVDWTALDGYNWGKNPVRPIGWRSFRTIFSASYTTITRTIAPHKPLMVAETASAESGGSKARWIGAMLRRLPRSFPRVRALLYFNKKLNHVNWPIESSSGATSAFRKGIQTHYYAGNRFGHLRRSPITPPSR
jgi:hypothetical protein